MRLCWSLGCISILLRLACVAPATGQTVSNQSFEVTPEVARATIGDSITVRFRVRLDERDLLFDTIPQPVKDLRSGVRLLSVDKMTRTPDRIFHGTARLAFYRTGRQAIPVFGVPFMRAVKGVERATLTSDSAFVDVVPLLPAGNPSLKDIKELEAAPEPTLWPLLGVAGLGLLALAWYLVRRRRRPVAAEAAPASTIIPETATPYDRALAELDRVELAGWPVRGEVARHYEAVVNVLREYLEESEGIPAKEQTSAELLWALPPHLTELDGRAALADLLEEADLVKFAKYRPSAPAAAQFLERVRSLLRQWRDAAVPAMGDALR
jgi:MYXO-CTERM domain-containing protein